MMRRSSPPEPGSSRPALAPSARADVHPNVYEIALPHARVPMVAYDQHTLALMHGEEYYPRR